MHELSIAMGIVRIAENESAKVNAQKVEKIELEIGTLSGIEIDALNFVWPSAVKGTVLQDALKKIIIVNGEAQCKDCEHIFELNQMYDACPVCNGYLKTIVKGKEMLVKSMELSY
jgi:hydrogenase nickel incorporation protein HypA/HybF